jgi:hypothetical protein
VIVAGTGRLGGPSTATFPTAPSQLIITVYWAPRARRVMTISALSGEAEKGGDRRIHRDT